MAAIDLIIPILMAGIFVYGLYKGVNVFDTFVEGAKDGLSIIVKITPVIVGLVAAISMFKASGGLDVIVYALSPLARFFGFPKEVLPIAVMRPVSGSGALALLNSIFKTNGPDSFIGRIASVLAASTETTLYTIGVYMGSAGIKKTGATLPASLFAELCAIVMAVITVKSLFGG